MKIIKQGNADWPHTVHNVCRECGTIYVLEPDDDYGRDDSTQFGDHIRSKCPACQCTVRTTNPNIPRPVWGSTGVSLGGKIA